MATPEEVMALKHNWLNDPCYDLEDVPGFEEHRAELEAFAKAKQAEWQERRNRVLDEKAAALGVPGNRQLAAYVMELEHRIRSLEVHL